MVFRYSFWIRYSLVDGEVFFTDSTHKKANAKKNKYHEETVEYVKKRNLELETEINEQRKKWYVYMSWTGTIERNGYKKYSNKQNFIQKFISLFLIHIFLIKLKNQKKYSK